MPILNVVVRQISKLTAGMFNSRGLTVIGLGFLLILVSNMADAESVRMVKDLNKQAHWKINSSISNSTVSFHRRQLETNGSLSIWRSTEDRTEPVDLSIITDDVSELENRRSFVTEQYFYLETSNNELWQMTLDGTQARKVEPDQDDARFYSSSLLQDDSTGETFLLFEGSRFSGVRLFQLDEAAATLSALGQDSPDGFYWDSFLLGEHVFFSGRDSLWRMSKTGENREKIAEFDRVNGPTDSTNAQTLSYFTINTGSDYRCRLWRTDGTKRGTFPLTEAYVDSNPFSSNGCDAEVTVLNGDLALFKTVNSRKRRIEIWRTRGTLASTRMVRQIPLVSIPDRYNPRPTFLGLHRVGNSIWYTTYNRNRRPVAWVTDVRFSAPRSVIAGRINGVIDLLPAAGRMLIQLDNDGTNSTLYKADADGSSVKKIHIGRGHPIGRSIFEATNIQIVGKHAIMPYKIPGKLRELLIAVDLDSAKTSFRRGWNETSESSARGTKIIGGPDDTAYFCAASGARSRWNGGVYWSPDSTRFVTRLWRTDGTAENTRPVINQIDTPKIGNSRPKSDCGRFTVGGNKLYYVRDRRDVGKELWSANLDGTEQKLFADLLPGKASSNPSDIMGLPDGVIFTAAWKDARLTRYQPRRLMRAYRDGTVETLTDANYVYVIDRTGDKIWYLTTDQRNYDRTWDLWFTDGTAAGSVQVTSDILASNFVELDGDYYFSAKFSRESGKPPGIYRLSQGSTSPELVHKYTIDYQFASEEQIWGSAQGLTVYNGAIYFQQDDRLNRVDISNGEKTVIADPSTIDAQANLASFAVLNDQIYFLVSVSGQRVADPRWQIWRSSGAPADAVKIHEQRTPSESFILPLLQATPTSIWFFAENLESGTELWQLKP